MALSARERGCRVLMVGLFLGLTLAVYVLAGVQWVQRHRRGGEMSLLGLVLFVLILALLLYAVQLIPLEQPAKNLLYLVVLLVVVFAVLQFVVGLDALWRRGP